MRDTEKAFHWITDILSQHGITYKIIGGFAARAYGSDRELADIDIQVTDSDIDTIAQYVKPHITFGPSRYNDENWDLRLMTLSYAGQEIDIAGIEAKILNHATKQWEFCSENLNNIELKKIFGKQVPIESKTSLIAYKTKLAREVDLEDVKQLLSQSDT